MYSCNCETLNTAGKCSSYKMQSINDSVNVKKIASVHDKKLMMPLPQNDAIFTPIK
jgi:hypothetical protein